MEWLLDMQAHTIGKSWKSTRVSDGNEPIRSTTWFL